ncbi:large subunit ribosomal protein L7/L12 [Fistulifera solaris]|uniref:Large subunit ribosomal protein L7/L12 n=1 Tax=Fistulifera solaris TaxID=1519565 RepID=A0A1Z5JSY1_FISSO|nr:large subunit ribosomal protein L7/L12 [Fistulifera solaris]|eukprot:GAX16871.1 large subunit ribosomal protein L7/L12 [Fistulifera solaris]
MVPCSHLSQSIHRLALARRNLVHNVGRNASSRNQFAPSLDILARTRPFRSMSRMMIHSTSLRWDESNASTVIANNEAPKEYSTPELTRDAALHKAGLENPDCPSWQNPLIHQNPPSDQVFKEDFASEEAFQAAVNPAPPLEDTSGAPPAPEYLNALADEIVNLTVLEMNELVNKMAEHYGFNEGMLSPDDVAAGDMGDGGEETEAPVAKTVFDVKLTGFDASSKIKVIKEVRAIAGLGLKEAKEFVEGVPGVLMKDLKQDKADEIKAKLEAVGATVEIA